MKVDLLHREEFLKSIEEYIRQTINKYGFNFFVGKITLYNENEDIVVEIIGLEERISVSWKEGLLLINKQEELKFGDYVSLLSVSGKFLLLGKIIGELEELKAEPQSTGFNVVSVSSAQQFRQVRNVENPPNVVILSSGFRIGFRDPPVAYLASGSKLLEYLSGNMFVWDQSNNRWEFTSRV